MNTNNIDINNKNKITKKSKSSYNINTNKDIYYNIDTSSNVINKNLSISSQNNIINQNNSVLFHNQKYLNIPNNNYNESFLYKQNDSTTLNEEYSTHESELMSNSINNNLITSNYTISNFEKNIIKNNNDDRTIIQINNENTNDNKMIEVANKIPFIRFYVFIKKLKARCVFNILYQISYILNLLDLEKRKNFIKSLPINLPKPLERLFLINFPFQLIKCILPDYNNYHIPTTQEIIAPLFELIINLYSIPTNNTNALSPKSISENNCNSSKDTLYENDKSNSSSRYTISPLILPQSELPCKISPDNAYIIQTPNSYMNNKDGVQNNLETKQNIDNTDSNAHQAIVIEHVDRNNNIEYIDEIINSTSLESNSNNTYHLSKQHKERELSSLSPSKVNSFSPEHHNKDIHITSSTPKNNNNGQKDAPYNFLANNMTLQQTNLTLFPLSPFITLKNSDFEDSESELPQKKNSPPSTTTNTPSKEMTSSTNPSDISKTQNIPSGPTTTISTVAASIAALKESTISSLKHKGSTLSKIDKRRLSTIKNSNMVKNIVKSFEEINNFYQNALLEAAEKTNNTKACKRNNNRVYGSRDNNEENNSDIDSDVEDILEEEKQTEEPEEEVMEEGEAEKEMIKKKEKKEKENEEEGDDEGEKEEEEEEEEYDVVENENENIYDENNDNIILTAQDKMEINKTCDKMISESNFIHNSNFVNIKENAYLMNDYIHDSDLDNIKENTHLMNSYINDFNGSGNDGSSEIIKDFSIENGYNESSDDSESGSDISNSIGNSAINIENLDITHLTILLIENFIRLSDTEKEEFLNSDYFELIKNNVMNIQNDSEMEFSKIFKDPKMLNEFESHIEALQQCVKERDDIINYYYQEIINERIQNEKLLIFCENEQIEREETNKIITGLSKKIEMEEDYIKKLEVRCDMLIEKIKKYQSCCKHYEKSISLLSGNKANSLKLLNTENLSNPPSFVPTAAAMTSAASATVNPVTNDTGRPGIAQIINKLNYEKISKNEEIQYLKSLLKSYNGKHYYINENLIKKQIIEKTQPLASRTIPATIDGVPVIPVNTNTDNTTSENDLFGKRMMTDKYFNDERQLAKMEDTIIVSDEEENGSTISTSRRSLKEIEEEDDDIMAKNSKSIDLSIIDDLNIFNEKHYHEKMLNKKHQREYTKSFNKDTSEDEMFSEYAPTLVN